jgi:hypothetical protein
MNWNNASFVRKVIYLVGIAVLLLPIAALSQPATAGRGDAEPSAGGKLAQLRAEYRLSQAELGEIDPASETMKLATLGLRGVAVDILWYKALEYQKKQDFTGLELTVMQIIRLQPNFLKVWDFQAHNLSYNSSVEFDSYRDRYTWVKKGIDFLILGTHYNRDEPGMLYQVGWYTGHKIGRADESRQFRRMFKTDVDLHTKFREQGVEVDQGVTLYDGKPDNWLAGKLWFDRAESSAEHRSIRTKSPLIFYSGGPMASINAASAMEKDDGIYGQSASLAWSVGQAGWVRFGNRQIPTSLGITVQLNTLEDLKVRHATTQAKLDALAPGAREKIRQQLIASLPKREKDLFNKPEAERNAEEKYFAETLVAGHIRPGNEAVAAKVPREKQSEAREIADQLQRLEREIEMTGRYRGTVNFEYWRARCEAEQTAEALAARELVHDAEALQKATRNLNEARKKYEQAWENWAVVYERHPQLFDSIEADELVEAVERYGNLLGSLDLKFPADFKLKKLLEITSQGQAFKQRIEALQGISPESLIPDSEPTRPELTDKPAVKKSDEKSSPAGEKPSAPAKEATQPVEDKPAKEAAGEKPQ